MKSLFTKETTKISPSIENCFLPFGQISESIYLLYPIEALWRFAIKIIGFDAFFGTLLFLVSWVGKKTNNFIGHSMLYLPWQAAVAYCLSLFYAPVQENQTKLPLQEQP